MPFQVASTERKCATCTRWTGSRRAGPGNRSVEVESPSARGPCAEKTKGNIPVAAGQVCTKYERWEILRG
jgi:hypothetical protein